LDAKPHKALGASGFVEAKAFPELCSGQESLQGEAAVAIVEEDPQTNKPAAQVHHFCISIC